MSRAATLIVERRSTYNAALRKIAILVDGKKVGEVGNGQALEVDIASGAHEVRARIDWIESKPLTLEAGQGGIYRAHLEMAPAWLAVFALLGFTPHMTLKPA